jgi:hypothetical protein
MILFGRNHFLVKKVKPEEIGMFDAEHRSMHFELRQKYFHLYYIPFFPLGQEWFLRQNHELYHTTSAVENKLKNRFPSIVDWKSFALPILIFVGVILFSIMNSIQHHRYEESAKIERSEQKKLLTTQINNLNQYSYINFKMDYKDIYYKVNQTTKDSVELIEYEFPLPEIDSAIRSKISYNSSRLLFLELSKAKPKKKNWIKRKELINSINDGNNVETKYITSLNSNRLKLEGIIQIEDAQFIVNTDNEAKSVYYFELQNLALDAKVDSIVSEKKETWLISKKRDAKLLEKFAIRTENGTKATLYYTTTENQKQHTITLTRTNGELYISNSIQ